MNVPCEGVQKGLAHITCDILTSLFRASSRGSTPHSNYIIDGVYDAVAYVRGGVSAYLPALASDEPSVVCRAYMETLHRCHGGCPFRRAHGILEGEKSAYMIPRLLSIGTSVYLYFIIEEISVGGIPSLLWRIDGIEIMHPLITLN
jgi:hypothetical protein